MLAPLSWLKDYVDLTLPMEALAERLTLAGLAVDAIHHVGDWWDPETITVGRVAAALVLVVVAPVTAGLVVAELVVAEMVPSMCQNPAVWRCSPVACWHWGSHIAGSPGSRNWSDWNGGYLDEPKRVRFIQSTLLFTVANASN